MQANLDGGDLGSPGTALQPAAQVPGHLPHRPLPAVRQGPDRALHLRLHVPEGATPPQVISTIQFVENNG